MEEKPLCDLLYVVMIQRELVISHTAPDGDELTMTTVTEFAHNPPLDCTEEQFRRWWGGETEADAQSA